MAIVKPFSLQAPIYVDQKTFSCHTLMVTENLVAIKNLIVIERFSIATCSNQNLFNHHTPMATENILVAIIFFPCPPPPHNCFSSRSPLDGD
jgi:hypothetical protein